MSGCPMSSSPSPTPHTTQLRRWLARMQAGDPGAREEMLRGVSARLERLARGMLRRFPDVARWEQTGDVLQNALLRLLRALREVRPESMRQFYGLAAEQIRRELLDLVRHYRGARRPAAGYAARPAGGSTAGPPDQADPTPAPEELDRWSAFHEDVAKLPAAEREVVGLTFYHGWSQAEVAELFGVSERTVQRWWQSALLKLREHPRDQDRVD